jgi:hypothetical protein
VVEGWQENPEVEERLELNKKITELLANCQLDSYEVNYMNCHIWRESQKRGRLPSLSVST